MAGTFLLLTVAFGSVRNALLERLSPILTSALSAGLALIPLVLAGGAVGNEIQAPMGVVSFVGLLSSTTLNMVVVPALFLLFGREPEGAPDTEGAVGVPDLAV